MSYKPIQLTDEEIDELLNSIKMDSTYSSSVVDCYEYWNNYDDWDGESYGRGDRRKHDWTPILLSFQTVYNCSHCGCKKEKAKSEYCEDE